HRLRSPPAERIQNWGEPLTMRGEPVEHAATGLLGGNPRHHAGRLESAQPVCEHAGRNPRQPFMQILKPARSHTQVSQNQERPPLPEHATGFREPAELTVILTHYFIIRSGL